MHATAILLLLQRRAHETLPEGRGSEAGSSGDDSMTMTLLVIAAAILLAVIGRVVVHSLDKGRITAYAATQGWELISCQWRLFGPGWLGAGKSRIYSIVYRDRDGQERSAFVKTSVLAGVYVTQEGAG